MTAAQHGQRRRRRTQDLDAGRPRRLAGQGPAEGIQEPRVGPRDDQGGEPGEGRHARGLACLGLGGQKAVAVARQQGPHDRVGRLVGLDQYPARAFGPAGPAGDLAEQLIGAFAGPQVAAAEPQVGVDHADAGQGREMMPLGDHLGADQQVDLTGLHAAHEVRRGLRPGDGVAGHQPGAGIGKQGRDLLGQALDAGPAGGQAFDRAALRTGPVEARNVTAVMA